VPVDASVTWDATTVTVQATPPGNGEFGVSVKLVDGELDNEYDSGVPVGHSSLNELVDALTLRSKLTVIVESVATLMVPFTGVVEITLGAVAVVNENEKSAAIVSGGSTKSTSCTFEPVTVTVQVVPEASELFGVSVNVVGPPLCVNATGVPVGHSSANAPASTVTGSEKVTVGAVLAATWLAPSAGVVEMTVGAASTVVNENT
jgi:hypothetical protein